MKKRFSDPMGSSNINSDAALDIYCTVMSQDGIYGTALELEALSHVANTPVHIYYRSGSSSNDKITGPTKIVGEGTDQLPICVAFYMANKHYNLITCKAPIFYLPNNEKKISQ